MYVFKSKGPIEPTAYDYMGLFSVANESTFGALMNISGSRSVCVGLSQNKLQCVCSR